MCKGVAHCILFTHVKVAAVIFAKNLSRAANSHVCKKDKYFSIQENSKIEFNSFNSYSHAEFALFG